VNGLPIGERDHGQQRRDDEADRDGVRKGRDARYDERRQNEVVAYATDDSASEESTASPVTRDRRS